MSYTNSVGIMPGAASEKLPFVHSDFKPRSKFAKCFGGFKKFPRHGNGTSREYEGQKLPVIHYSAGEQRNLIALGTNSKGDRPEYPGFSGKKKILKKKDNSSTTVHPAISGSFTRSQANAMKHYLSLPNLNLIHQHSEAGNFQHLRHTNHDRKPRHKHKNQEEVEFMNYLQNLQQQQQQQYHLQQQQQQQQQQQHRSNNDNNYNMDSLFIVDDDDDEGIFPQNTMVVGNGVRFKEPLTSTNQNDSFHRCSPCSNHSNTFPSDHERMNPFAKEVDKKLRDARGKSGMKRDRRREPDHMRILGDVVTAERMHELLMPRKTEAPLNFDENV